MGVSTIEWTDYTFNPWKGCQKVSPGCKNCYAEADADKRRKICKFGPHKGGGTRVVTSPANWAKLDKWNREAQAEGVVKKVFVASEADIFEDWDGPMLAGFSEWKGSPLEILPDKSWYIPGFIVRLRRTDARQMTMQDLREQVFRAIEATPWLIYILVTKRPENVMRMVPEHWRPKFPENVWIVTSVEDQQRAEQRLRHIVHIPASVRGLSVEPQIGKIDLSPWMPAGFARWICMRCSKFHATPEDRFGHIACPFCGEVDFACGSHLGNGHPNGQPLGWIIQGFESGPEARPYYPGWAMDLRDACASAGVPYLFKQWGQWGPLEGLWANSTRTYAWVDEDGEAEIHRLTPSALESQWQDDGPDLVKASKKANGRLLEGVEHNAFPRHLAEYQAKMEAIR